MVEKVGPTAKTVSKTTANSAGQIPQRARQDEIGDRAAAAITRADGEAGNEEEGDEGVVTQIEIGETGEGLGALMAGPQQRAMGYDDGERRQ